MVLGLFIVLWAALFRAFPWTLGIHGTQVVCMLDVKWFSLIPAGWRPDKLPAHRYQLIPHPTIIHHPTDPGQFKSISGYGLGVNQVFNQEDRM